MGSESSASLYRSLAHMAPHGDMLTGDLLVWLLKPALRRDLLHAKEVHVSCRGQRWHSMAACSGTFLETRGQSMHRMC